jgi:protein required for attachment to host cells
MKDFNNEGDRITIRLPIKLTNDNEGRTKHFAAAHTRRECAEGEIVEGYSNPLRRGVGRGGKESR